MPDLCMDLYLGAYPRRSLPKRTSSPDNSRIRHRTTQSSQVNPTKSPQKRRSTVDQPKHMRSGVKPCGELSCCIGFASPFHSLLHGTGELTNSHGFIDLASVI